MIFSASFCRIGEAYSHNTGKRMVKWSEEEIVDTFSKIPGPPDQPAGPWSEAARATYRELFEDLRKKGT